MPTYSRVNLATAILVASLLTACVEFTEQRLSYTVGANELTIFQEYQGIHAKDINISDKKPKKPKTTLSEDEQQEIDSVVNGERTFFFSNWIQEYNRSHLEKELARYNEGKSTPEERAEQRNWIPLVELLLANVKVTNGDFYYDEKQRLSGYQVVRVKNLDQLIAQANKSISQWILQTPPTDATIMTDQIKAMATVGHAWIQRDHNKITISYPVSTEEYAELQQESSSYIGNDKPPVTVIYKDGIATINIGAADDTLAVISKVSGSPYSPIAVNYVSSKYPIKNNLDIAGLKQSLFTRHVRTQKELTGHPSIKQP